eukprot:834039-Amphidinium_carterae.1
MTMTATKIKRPRPPRSLTVVLRNLAIQGVEGTVAHGLAIERRMEHKEPDKTACPMKQACTALKSKLVLVLLKSEGPALSSTVFLSNPRRYASIKLLSSYRSLQ